MRRVVAVLGAVLLVVVAVFVRGLIDGDDDSGGDDGGNGSPSGTDVTLVCIEELQAVCEAMEADGAIAGFSTEDGGETVDRLAAGEDLEADGWLAIEPFPGMADVGRGEAGLDPLFDEPAGVGFTATPALVTHPGRSAAFEEACNEVDWRCVGDMAGEQWGDHGGDQGWGEVNVGLESPDSATGLLAAGQAASDYLSLDTFATNDLDSTAVVRWLDGFDEGDDVLRRMRTEGPGAFSAVGVLDQQAEAAQGADLGIFYPAPMFRAEVVLVAAGGSADDLVDGDALAEALAAEGWREGGTEGMSSPGAYYALREEL